MGNLAQPKDTVIFLKAVSPLRKGKKNFVSLQNCVKIFKRGQVLEFDLCHDLLKKLKYVHVQPLLNVKLDRKKSFI